MAKFLEKKINNDMENNSSANSGQGNKFANGFLLGALIGAGVVFLLGTEKGKKLLKAISEEGVENISHILEEASEPEDLDETDAGESDSNGNVENKENPIERVKPKVKRFFRGVSKRFN